MALGAVTCEEALLRNQLNTLGQSVHQKLAIIAEEKEFSEVDPERKAELLRITQSAAHEYANDVGGALTERLLKHNKTKAITFGSKIFQGFIDLVNFFGDSLKSQLDMERKHPNVERRLIRAIKPPPKDDWTEMTKQNLEAHNSGIAYNLILPNTCFQRSEGRSIIKWLQLFLYMSKCLLSHSNPSSSTPVKRKQRSADLRDINPERLKRSKRRHQTNGDLSMSMSPS